MELNNQKCVMIIDQNLPLGLIANTAAVLGISLGKMLPDAVGSDVKDQSGQMHAGLVQIPVPILKGSADLNRLIRQKLSAEDFDDVICADFSDLAQSCRTYEQFTEKMAETPERSLQHSGLVLWGPRRKISRLTGSLPLLR